MERSDREPTADGSADASNDPATPRRVIHVGRVVDDELDDDIPPLEDDADEDEDEAEVLAEDSLEAERSDTRFDDGVQLRSRVRPAPRRRRGGIAPALLLFGASVWAAVAILRCRGPEELPPTAVPIPEDSPGEPADVTPEDAAPDPAADAKRRTEQPDAPTEPDPTTQGDGWPKGVRPEWADGLELPTTVRYTIRRGGTLENVANLFRIFHHEILENNPGIEIDKELAPDTRVIVWKRKDGKKSESIGLPSRGSIEYAVPMVEGPGRRLLAVPNRTWATAETIAVLDRVLDQWADRGDVQAILVGNLSNREGGKLEPHSTHQSGRDVDLGYPQKLGKGAELTWQEIRADNLDAAETWELLKLLVATEAVEEIYVDRSIQKLLHEDAVANERVPEASLKRWMEYPRPTGTADTVIKHVPGHTDHLHVRFACPKSHARCKSR